MRFVMPIICLLGAGAIFVLGLVIAAWYSSYHYSLYRELVSRGAIVETTVPPRHPSDPIAADGSYDTNATLERMGATADGAIVVGSVAALMLFMVGASWYFWWPSGTQSDKAYPEETLRE